MNRFLATTAIIALSTACCVATPIYADDATPSPAPATDAAPQPKTMQDAIAIQIADAKQLRLQGRVDDAAKAFAQLMFVAPTNPEVLGEYGKALAQQGHSQEAVALLTRATQINSSDWTYYSALGVSYDQLDKRKEAREAYDRALALKPGEPSVLNNYAVSRMLAGDYAGAQNMLEQVQASGTNDPKVAGNLAKLAQLEAAHPQKVVPVAAASSAPTTAAANTPAPVSVATLPPAASNVMMQKVPVDPLAGPVGKPHATHAPAPIVTASAPKVEAKSDAKPAPVAVASAAPKIDPATTMMQKVPVDPQAGPVVPHEANAAPRALAVAKPKAAPVAVAAVKTPALVKPATAAVKPAVVKPKTELATATQPKLSAPPSLRTASDSN